jgi:hypothetical protein
MAEMTVRERHGLLRIQQKGDAPQEETGASPQSETQLTYMQCVITTSVLGASDTIASRRRLSRSLSSLHILTTGTRRDHYPF